MPQQRHGARISWRRDGAEFVDREYSRVHQWSFDGGATVKASASPSNVPEPYTDPGAVDPEEALVAAASSCHMLWFLANAARRGFVVDSYVDEPEGLIEQIGAGRCAFTKITLRPRIEFSGGQRPNQAEVDAMHAEAHNSCFIANSLSCDVIVAAA